MIEMASKWQRWLSPRLLRHTKTPAGPRMLSPHDAALYEFSYGERQGLVVTETHFIANEIVKAGLSGPPLHIHLRQTEFFQVEQGTLAVCKNEKEHVLTKNDGVVVVPAGTRHRFWVHHSSKEDVVFKVWAEPQDVENSFDENFLRHFLGYLRDCQEANMKPSIFQLALFGAMSDTVLTPPFWMPIWILRAAHYILAHWVAAPLLGYHATIPEYSIKKSD